MSVAPIQVGATNKTLQAVAYVVSGGLVTGVKTDIVVADIDTLYVRRDQTTAITISSDGTGMTDKSNQNDAHSDGAVWNAGGGKLIVDVPDTAFAVYAPDVELYGTWTDGSDSGIIRGTPVAMTNGYTWATFGATILNRIGAFTGTGVNTILGFFKAIMFSDATEPSDAGDAFAASLEEVKASISAITQDAAANSERVAEHDIELFTGEVIERTITANQDVSAKTMELVIKLTDGDHTQIQLVESGDLTVSGTSVTFTNSATVTASPRTMSYSLRDTTTGEVYRRGNVRVKEVVLKDA